MSPKAVVVLCLLLGLLALASANSSRDGFFRRAFKQWQNKHGIHFEDAKEEAHRLEIFTSNLKFINQWNRNNKEVKCKLLFFKMSFLFLPVHLTSFIFFFFFWSRSFLVAVFKLW